MDKQVCIGTIVAPHGVRGDIRILPQTEHPEQFLELDYLLFGGWAHAAFDKCPLS